MFLLETTEKKCSFQKRSSGSFWNKRKEDKSPSRGSSSWEGSFLIGSSETNHSWDGVFQNNGSFLKNRSEQQNEAAANNRTTANNRAVLQRTPERQVAVLQRKKQQSGSEHHLKKGCFCAHKITPKNPGLLFQKEPLLKHAVFASQEEEPQEPLLSC